MIENKLRREMGWDQDQFFQHDVSAQNILEKDIEDYLLKNDARKQYMMQLARQESSPSPSKDYEESPAVLKGGPKKPMLEWMPELSGPIAKMNQSKIKDIKSPRSNFASTARTKEVDKTMNKNQSVFKQKWNLIKHGDELYDDQCAACLIDGCDQEVAESGDNGSDLESGYISPSKRAGSNSNALSISNDTSFSDFYNFKPDDDIQAINQELGNDSLNQSSSVSEHGEDDTKMPSIQEAEKAALGFRFLPQHKFKKYKYVPPPKQPESPVVPKTRSPSLPRSPAWKSSLG